MEQKQPKKRKKRYYLSVGENIIKESDSFRLLIRHALATLGIGEVAVINSRIHNSMDRLEITRRAVN